MASKLLIRTGNPLINRLRSSLTHHNNRILNPQTLLHGHGHGTEATPMLFPSLSKLQTVNQLQMNDAESLRKLQLEGIFFPFGLPSLPFFLPDGMLFFLYQLCLTDLLDLKSDSEAVHYIEIKTSVSFGDTSSSQEPMLLMPKRTFQPSTIRRKRNHGFFARKATTGGRKVIARRIAKGRFRITA